MIDSRRDAAATPRRKPYTKPSLTKYGRLKDLTTGGSGNAQESSSGQKPRP
jgi:hypothetical protein